MIDLYFNFALVSMSFQITPPCRYLKLKTLLTVLSLTLSLNTIAIDAHQAGEQITSQIINKAISTTEGYINTQANEFINNFGKGRASISIKGIESDKPSYRIDTIQPISEFNSEIKELTYIQGSLASGENEGDRRYTLNLGLGQRYLVEEERAIAGINLFMDYEGTSKHKRASLGLEYQRSNFSLNANKYYPITDKKVIGDYTEEPLAGYDIKLTGQMPYAPWASIKGTHYYWDQTVGDNINGNILGVEIQLSPSTSFEFGQENSNTQQRQSYGKLSIKLPFDDNEKATNFTLDDAPFRIAAIMDLTTLKTTERNNKIKIEKLNIASVFTSDVSASVAENQTSAITLVATDVHGVTYSISGTDSSLFNVNSSTGVVTFKTAPDYESPGDSGANNVYDFTATITDSVGATTTQSVSIGVTDVSEGFASGDTFNGKVYLTVTSPDTGRVWLDRNLGATQVATSSTDSFAYGDMYQWGRAADGHESRTSTIAWSVPPILATTITPGTNTFIINSYSTGDWTDADSSGASRTSAWADGGVNDICPAGFSVPTEAELTADTLSATTTDITNSATAFSSFLKIPLTGLRVRSTINVPGVTGFLWSRSADGLNGRILAIHSGGAYIGQHARYYGLGVRCIGDVTL